MAMSFSHPDPSSPTSIAEASFGTSRRGFDQAEVRDFLQMVGAEFARLRERERFLERELEVAQSTPGATAKVDEATMTQVLGEEAMRVLTTARESATEIREKAELSAAQLLSEASDESARLREEAEIEASRRRSDAAADAEAEVAMAKQQGREMVNEARAYRERVLSELARRRELAREQIEQLVHGRDRLMQAFERARLVAVDVVAEMQPLGEPDEYVNLAPTTGPLPVMIANSPRPAESVAAPVATPAPEPAAEPTETVASAPVTEPASSIPMEGGDLRIVADDVTGESTESTETGESAETADVAGAADVASDPTDVEADGARAADVDAVDEAATTSVVESDVDEADGNSEAREADEADEADESDDVVVDLFARLRADVDPEAEAPADSDGAAASPDETDADVEAPIAPNDAVVAAVLAASDDSTSSSSIASRAAQNDAVEAADEVEAADQVDAAIASNDDVEPEPTSFEERDAAITPLIVSSAKKLKRALADEQNEVLDALRRSDGVHTLDILLPWASEHGARYTTAIADDLLDAVYAGSSVSHVGNRKIRKALATEAVQAADEALVKWLVLPLRDRLERCIDEGGGDNTVVTKKVRAVYREWKTQRIDETLDDVVRAAHGRGVLAGFDPDVPIVWTIDNRFPACPDCDDNALAGPVAAGRPFPTGDVCAPAHQGCRCLLAPAEG